jgi:hypothetical protein
MIGTNLLYNNYPSKFATYTITLQMVYDFNPWLPVNPYLRYTRNANLPAASGNLIPACSVW